ncbi:alpha/beta fold hydrolase [Oceanobacter mangrovi]|uniref:alpha/beta fold hydrolase n=1 Tax=Oceanobacter mangrovi TaxID=2862510 RepID=UPI001C8D7D41|nr:alpha/beta fold hydrolase [Oceanobacter mangrovi]
MKSSSELFPVTLARAENLAGFTDDVYLVKHNLDLDRSVEVAVSHLSPGSYETSPLRNGSRPSVVLLHGAFNNRTVWLGHDGEGLAAWLVRQGFDVWLMEMRGHGYSPRNLDYSANNTEQYALCDIPAVHDFVHEKSGCWPVWIGHSLGAVAIASALAAGKLTAQNCPGIVTLGAQILKRPWYLWMPLGATTARLLMTGKSELDGRKVGIGPENEPVGITREMLSRRALFGKWQLEHDKRLLLPHWRSSSVPALMMMGPADDVDPLACCRRFAEQYGADNEAGIDKTLTVLAAGDGFSHDFGHNDMVRGEQAQAEVWPLIESWLGQRVGLT